MDRGAPLLGKRILIPRGKNEAKSFRALVENYGGIPVEIPLLAFRPVCNPGLVEHLEDNIHTYDWIIFTSNVTVETFFSFFQNQNGLFPKIAVIGKRTGLVVNKRGYNVEFVPQEYVAEGFVRDFLPYVTKGMKVLIPKGSLARDYIAESLTDAGAIVDELIVYETYLPEDSRTALKLALAENSLDVLTFTSPSTVDHFMQVVKEHQFQVLLPELLVCCIGPITKEKLEAEGLKVDVMPHIYTVEAMLKDLITYLHITLEK
jgi:uroporphyrinogen-III synthase